MALKCEKEDICHSLLVFMQVPCWSLVALGCYALSSIGYELATLADIAADGEQLKKVRQASGYRAQTYICGLIFLPRACSQSH